ncbi:hypothetical protein [Pelotalea chapellei]|uniref:hypothetical protein n=1 Tax=Pelotalea chapellei TaxID=44671 RepID=UPI0034633CA6
MTALAVSGTHVGTVRLMALGTLRNLAVNIVAEAAGQLGVFTRDLFQFDDLRSMAGKAFVSNVVGKLDNLGCVRIVVATQTVRQFLVRLVAVAHAALGNDIFLYCGGMANMAILACNIGLMCSTVCLNIGRGGRVALDTIRIAQSNFGLGRLSAESYDRQQTCHRNRQQESSQG